MKLIIHDVHDDHPECHNKDIFLKKEMFNHPIHLLSFNSTKAEKEKMSVFKYYLLRCMHQVQC